jgi:probable F420-dependent oxidoreductase
VHYVIVYPHRGLKHFDRWIGDGHFEDAATIGEAAGFEAFMVFDHPLPTDAWMAGGGHHSFDPFVALSFAAKATTHIKLMTGVLIGAYRNAYITAKALASLDKLSGGRVIAGMASGYLKAEFEALGVADEFDARGAILDETIDAMRDVWRGESLHRSGGYFPAEAMTSLPPPAQSPLPIWIGGNAARAARRAVELGDGWMPGWLPPAVAKSFGTDSLHTLELMATRTAQTQAKRAALGKAPLEIACSPYEDFRSDWSAGCRALKANLSAYEDAGIGWLMIDPPSRSLDAYRDDVNRFADIVMS